MTADEPTAYLHASIPILADVGVQALECSPERPALRAPLAANGHHPGRAFGGSLARRCITSGWARLYTALEAAGLPAGLVVQRSELDSCGR